MTLPMRDEVDTEIEAMIASALDEGEAEELEVANPL